LRAKLNRARRATNPITLLSTIEVVLAEVASMDLLWNSEVAGELEARRQARLEESRASAALRVDASRYVRLAMTVNLLDRASISGALRPFPAAEQSVLGALDALARGGPDAERQAVTSCRSAIENVCIQRGGVGDWKAGLKALMPSESDQRAVQAVVNFLGAKLHGGHVPTRSEAEQGLKLSVAILARLVGEELVGHPPATSSSAWPGGT
jgi:hypothetical protein